MTKTLTTERLKQLAGFKGAPAWGEEERSMAAELLRYREAAETPSCWEIAGQLFTTKEEALKTGYRGTPEPLYDGPVLTDDREAQPVASREHFESLCNQFWNWDEFDEINAEEEPRLGWDGKNYTHRVTAALWRMYQAAPPSSVVNPEFTGATAVPDEMPESVYSILSSACGDSACLVADELWNACRAAMLAQPVSQGCKLVPVKHQNCPFCGRRKPEGGNDA